MTGPFRQTFESWERQQSRRLLTHFIPHDGRRRAALLYIPQHMLARGPLPLVVALHGGASAPETMAQMSALHLVAEREGFIVAYPTGSRGRSGLTWSPAGREAARANGDTRFVRELIVDLQRRLEIDPARVYAVGFSIGGSLVYELACLAADRIAAVAVVSGTMTTSYRPPVRPVPLIHIHGSKDRRVPLEGGRGPATTGDKEWLPVQDCIDLWCEMNGCPLKPDVVRLGREGVTGYRHPGPADVELWVVEGGGHAWPGGKRGPALADDEPLASGFSASEKIWAFLAAHRREPGVAPPAPGRRRGLDDGVET